MKSLLAALAVMLVSTAAMAQPAGADAREANQQQRIDRGVQSGQLTNREANKLEKQEVKTERMEGRAEKDGKVTPREQAKLDHRLNKASHRIYKQKHDAQTTPAAQ
jgi:hypothetical protein